MIEAISRPVRDFIFHNIGSVEALEVLFFLFKRKERAWSAETISGELRSDPGSVRRRLADLKSRGLVEESDEAFRYLERDANTSALIVELEGCFRSSPFRVIELIFSKPNDVLRTFADAFRLKKGEDSDDR